MRLPNADRAVVERTKIVEYLLNPTHRFGASKSAILHPIRFSAGGLGGLGRCLAREQ